MAGVVTVGVGHQSIAFVYQPIQILFRQACNTAQHAHGQLARNLMCSIKLTQGQCLVENVHTQLTNLVFVNSHHGLRKCFCNQHAGTGVFWWIGFLKSASRKVLLASLVFHANALGRA